MATYKTVPRAEYDRSFQEVAQVLFDATSHQVAPECAVMEKGSYSFRADGHSNETLAKILIFQRNLGVQMQGELPWRNNGIYVLVRANGEYGDLIWERAQDSGYWARMRREDNVAVAPNYNARFAHFPVMAGESLEAIAGFIGSVIVRVR